MQPEVRARNDSLQSLDSAIAETLTSGADSEDIRRVVNAATLRFRGNRKRTRAFHDGSRCLPGRVHRLGCLLCAVVLSIAIAIAVSFPAQQVSQPTEIELKDVWENIYALSHPAGDDGEDHPPADIDATIQSAVSQYHSAALFVSKFLANDLPVTGSKHGVCPLDAFFHDGCRERDGGTVCIFPGAILKKIDEANWNSEMDGFKVLNDTRFFPELYYVDPNCRTVLEENVSPPGHEEGVNRWCANYTYYEAFYKSAFEIFDKNNIIPQDLNICCNTIVDGTHIRIIDFGRYKFNEPPEIVRSQNEILLDEILTDIVKKMNSSSCTSFYRKQKKYNSP